MTSRLFTLLPLTLCLLLTGCPAEGTNYRADDPKLATARLEIVGTNTFGLRYGQNAELVVRYVFEDGTAISGAPLDWELTGVSGGSSIDARRVDTRGDGTARVGLTAGTTNTNFSVVVTPPQGNRVTFLISVSENPGGSISIEMLYSGMERFDEFTPYLFQGSSVASCDALDPEALPMAERIGTPVRSLFDRPDFIPVTPANNWVVAVVADIGGEVAAFGCSVGVNVVQGEETRVVITLLDYVPDVRFEGTYDLGNRFDFGEGLPDSVNTALEVLDELTDDQNIDGNAATEDWGQDPGAFVVDMAMRTTCHWECTSGEDYSSCSEINHRIGDLRLLYTENFTSWSGAQSRFFAGCAGWEIGARTAQEFVNMQIGTYVPEVVLRFLDAAGDLSRAITDSRIQSVLMLEPEDEFGEIPFDHRLRIMEVRLRDLGGAEHFFMFNLADVGVMELSRTGLASARGNELTLPAHTFELHLGRLVQYIYLNGLLPLFGFTSTADMLASWIDCDSVATAIHGSIGGVTDRLSVDQYRNACNEGIMGAGDYVDENIAGFIDVGATMTISGTATGTELTTDGLAQALEDGEWTGSWDEAGAGGAIAGTFTGRRR